MGIPGVKKIRCLYNALRSKLYLFKGSDGYHTFDELYEHRHALFGAFIKLHGGWKSKLHSDGSSYNGWFIAGTTVNGKQISYHLPLKYFDTFPATKRSRAPKYDGHTPKEVVSNLLWFWYRGQ